MFCLLLDKPVVKTWGKKMESVLPCRAACLGSFKRLLSKPLFRTLRDLSIFFPQAVFLKGELMKCCHKTGDLKLELFICTEVKPADLQLCVSAGSSH